MSKLALKIQRYCKSVLLLGLLKGLAITGRHWFTKKITVFAQNFDLLTTSTTMPNARSLSATCAVGVGFPGLAPLV